MRGNKINGGMCAVRVPAGDTEISFTYTTPGLKIGIIMSIGGVLMFAVYMLYFPLFKRRNGRSYAHMYTTEGITDVKAHKSYIDQLSERIYNCHERGGRISSDEQVIEFPDVDESFMDKKKYDFSKLVPKKRNSHITEDDEAYRVMEELDKKDDEE